MPHRISPGQNLLIDADDTLWENNIYFERAIANFISFLNHHEFTPDLCIHGAQNFHYLRLCKNAAGSFS